MDFGRRLRSSCLLQLALALARARACVLAQALAPAQPQALPRSLAPDLARALAPDQARAPTLARTLARTRARARTRALAPAQALNLSIWIWIWIWIRLWFCCCRRLRDWGQYRRLSEGGWCKEQKERGKGQPAAQPINAPHNGGEGSRQVVVEPLPVGVSIGCHHPGQGSVCEHRAALSPGQPHQSASAARGKPA